MYAKAKLAKKTLHKTCVITSICLDDCQSYVRHKLSQLVHDDKMLLAGYSRKNQCQSSLV